SPPSTWPVSGSTTPPAVVAEAAAAATGEQLDRLERGDVSHLAAALVRAELPSAHGKFGMCGRLDVYKGTD
ncbi:hypothetical protein ABT255_34880, partial [Streptomyces mirabilis]